METARVRTMGAWCSVVLAMLAAIVVAYVKNKHVFAHGNDAELLVQGCIAFSCISLILGALSLRRWQGILAILISSGVLYVVIFTPLYMLA